VAAVSPLPAPFEGHEFHLGIQDAGAMFHPFHNPTPAPKLGTPNPIGIPGFGGKFGPGGSGAPPTPPKAPRPGGILPPLKSARKLKV
jgi:hypothetical protein